MLQSYWVLVVMDQLTRRLVGCSVHHGTVTGADVCRMFNTAIHGQGRTATPQYGSRSGVRRAPVDGESRILEIDEIKTVPHVPLSHPYVERLIGTVRREFLDHVLFWSARALERKLGAFRLYYNAALPLVVEELHAVDLRG